jgi:hypothetical protein
MVMYETTDVYITKQGDFVAWMLRTTNGAIRDKPQGPFHVHDIYEYVISQIEECTQELDDGKAL